MRGGVVHHVRRHAPAYAAMARGALRGIGAVLKRRRFSSNVSTDNSSMHPTLSNQFPSRTVYRNKGESRRHKRKRLRQVALSLKGDLAQIAPQKFINIRTQTLNLTAGLQSLFFLTPLYGMKGLPAGHDTVNRIGSYLTPVGAGTTALGWPTQFSSEKKVKFMSARQVLELVTPASNTGALYVSLYEYFFTTDCTAANLSDLFATQSSFPASSAIPISVTLGVAFSQVGVTPFDIDEIIGKIHITKKTELIIPPGTTQEFEMNDLKPKTLDYGCFQNKPTNWIAKAGWTKGILLVAVGQAVGGSAAIAGDLTVLTTDRYSVKPLPNNLLMGTSTLALI